MVRWIKILLELTKLRISLLAAFSTAMGFVLARGGLCKEILLPIFGIFFMACGSCALNQYQDRKIDGLAGRTKNRPLPSGKLDPNAVLTISLALISLGSLILFYRTNVSAFALGLVAVLWYNGVYTYLKRKTAFAALPGALIGTIPPALGWVSGGGSLSNPQIWGIAFFFFIWQVPHFWLLLLDFAEDYDRAGIPSITKIFSKKQIKGIVFIWLLSTGVSSLLLPVFGFFHSFFVLLLGAAAFWLFCNALIFLRSYSRGISFGAIFTKLNIYTLLVISFLSLDRILISGLK